MVSHGLNGQVRALRKDVVASMTQLELMPIRIPSKDTQCYAILRYLQDGGRLTVAKALMELGCYALSQRCGELRGMGWPIQSRMVEIRKGTRVAEYRLA